LAFTGAGSFGGAEWAGGSLFMGCRWRLSADGIVGRKPGWDEIAYPAAAVRIIDGMVSACQTGITS
jgi:hypothetical protein